MAHPWLDCGDRSPTAQGIYVLTLLLSFGHLKLLSTETSSLKHWKKGRDGKRKTPEKLGWKDELSIGNRQFSRFPSSSEGVFGSGAMS